ncbi:MAG TPA: prepilin peptidase [Acidobacteriaceae bacterium]|nr:prepilin peptidase [Acidobacteriaceae bacterium]
MHDQSTATGARERPYTHPAMMRDLATVFAALLGLAFGSFLNVCVSRWPEGESIVQPRSHCMSCGQTLSWWENLPLASWIALKGRCRTCRAWIGWRYPLIELAVGALWAAATWQTLAAEGTAFPGTVLVRTAESFCFYWLLVALAALDAEHFWLPDMLTLPGIAAGFLFTVADGMLNGGLPSSNWPNAAQHGAGSAALHSLLAIVGAAAVVGVLRWTYRLIRKREGMGLGDVKLMALLGAWLGFSGALLALVLGVSIGALAAVILLVLAAGKGKNEAIWLQKLPLGTFLCVGGAISGLFGREIIAAYLRMVGL